MSEDSSNEEAYPAGISCGLRDFNDLPDSLTEAARDCLELVGGSAEYGDWRLVGSDGLNTQTWHHPPTQKVIRLTAFDGGTLLVKVIKPGESDAPINATVEEMMDAGLIRATPAGTQS